MNKEESDSLVPIHQSTECIDDVESTLRNDPGNLSAGEMEKNENCEHSTLVPSRREENDCRDISSLISSGNTLDEYYKEDRNGVKQASNKLASSRSSILKCQLKGHENPLPISTDSTPVMIVKSSSIRPDTLPHISASSAAATLCRPPPTRSTRITRSRLHDTRNTKRSSSFVLCLFVVGLICSITGILVGFASCTMELLMLLRVVGSDKSPFGQVDIWFGMFSIMVRVMGKNVSNIQYEFQQRGLLWMTASQQIGAWASSIVAFTCVLLVIAVQVALICRKDMRRWYWMSMELCLLLAAVLCILASIAFCETQFVKLNSKHDLVKKYVTNLLSNWSSQFIPSMSSPQLDHHDLNTSTLQTIQIQSTSSPILYAFYLVTGLHLSFWLLIVVDFLFLFSILLSVPFFIHIVQEEEEQKRQKTLKKERARNPPVIMRST